MDYVCKVGTPAGEVVERTFSAADEAALRAELAQRAEVSREDLAAVKSGKPIDDVIRRVARHLIAEPVSRLSSIAAAWRAELAS